MKLKEFIEKGYKVEVDVPVLTSREFDVEGFIKDDGVAWEYDGDDLESWDWDEFYDARKYTVLDPNNDIVKENLEEENLKEFIERM